MCGCCRIRSIHSSGVISVWRHIFQQHESSIRKQAPCRFVLRAHLHHRKGVRCSKSIPAVGTVARVVRGGVGLVRLNCVGLVWRFARIFLSCLPASKRKRWRWRQINCTIYLYAAYLQLTTTYLLVGPSSSFAFSGPGRRVMFAQQASLYDGGLFFSFCQPAVRSLLHLEFAYAYAPPRKEDATNEKVPMCYVLAIQKGDLINGHSWGQSRSLFRSCISESASSKPNYELTQPRGPD